jgi:SNF2 family DNA or RNA helicase
MLFDIKRIQEDMSVEFNFKTKPYQHQIDILNKSWDLEYFALFAEMGTGKSKIIVDNFVKLYSIGEIDTVVIIAKKGEYANWHYDQIPTHIPENIRYKSFLYTTTKVSSVKGAKQFDAVASYDGLKIFIINVESLISPKTKKYLDLIFNKKNKVFFVVDESTCVKEPSSKRSKVVYDIAAKAKYRRIMTGTAITQSPLDIWGQALVLKRGILGTTSYFSFRGRYAVMEPLYLGQRVIKRIVGYQNIEELSNRIKSFSVQVLKKDCLDLPDKIYKKHVVEMTPTQEHMYDKLKEEAIIALDNGESLEVVHALTMMSKLHQIVCGQLKISDDHYQSVENNRIPALLEILEDYDGKVIIWANYRQTLHDCIKAIADKFGEESVAGYYGGVSDADRVAAVKNFQDLGHPLRFFVANPQSAGFGITLTASSLVIYYSNSFNLEHRLQSEDRAHRIGQTKNVEYIDLFTPGTIDERIVNVLRSKKNLSDAVMQNPSIKAWI